MKATAALILSAGCLAGGCGMSNTEYMTEERLARGLVILLPGIEGEGPLSYSVRSGLLDAGVTAALPIYPWGRPIPLAGPLINQMDFLGNRLAAERIADTIVDYQDAHPGCPVFLVGHSGGGGVAVFSAEALPEGRKVDGLILLSASISSGYDLTKALSRCNKGIVNFYSRGDTVFLIVGTTLAGNVDGVRGPAAGAVGFDRSFRGLWQREWTEEMAASGNYGGHMDTASAPFVERYVAPWILSWVTAARSETGRSGAAR